ncbi:spermidine synthase [Haloechinothrix sp. LS1_15]|uniref:spermine/spermidine synthase domain-containing protein n=1 Tax=Haloechinothrix sp. LS1_15 TaxID=2652248 RepID=UPI002944DA05|nr:spermidine synthase [Haloechinothrix sp. LS1_15]MDV6013020.1 spermidine synthase [Haloechinothrix sp. LS1_15]
MAEVIDVVDGECGEIALRSDGEHFEVIADGVFLMDTRNGDSERLLVTTAIDELAADRGPVTGGLRVLIGGLGVGFSLRAALDHPAVTEVVVVEREPAVVKWNVRGPLRRVNDDALDDARVRVIQQDLLDWLPRARERFDAMCLDIDNGPLWTVSAGNAHLYSDDGVELAAARLREGGVVSVWGAEDDATFTARLQARFTEVRRLHVPARRGEPDVIWLAADRRVACCPPREHGGRA